MTSHEIPVAVAPEPLPWVVDAVHAGGGLLTELPAAEALVWTAVHQAEDLAHALINNSQIQWVHLIPAGIESIVETGVVDETRTWTSGKGLYAKSVAEHALALTLAVKRRLMTFARIDRWSEATGSVLTGSRVVVLGGGGVASEYIRLLEPFECSVTVIRRRPLPTDGAATALLEDLDVVLKQADVATLALALTPETEGIINRRTLALMRRNSILINVARGRHIVTEDLVNALRANAIAGAGLDVTDPEPLPEGHPLWTLNNALVTPHIANPPEQARKAAADRIETNICRWRSSQQLIGTVDPVNGY